MDKYRYIVPIGEWCILAHILDQHGLRKAAFPFDWCFSNLGVVMDMLTYPDLVRDVYLSSPESEWPVYDGYAKQLSFPHHDISDPKVQSGWTRAISRLQWVINNKQPLMLLHAAVDGTQRDLDKLERIYQHLTSMECNVCLVSIQQTLGTETQISISGTSIIQIDVVCKHLWAQDNWDGSKEPEIWNRIIDIIKPKLDLADLPPSSLL